MRSVYFLLSFVVILFAIGILMVFDTTSAEVIDKSLNISTHHALIKQLVYGCLGGIFALLVFMFKSYLKPIIVLTTIPLGLLGFAIAFYLHGMPISFLALIGVIGLAGMIVNAGIVLISFIDQLKNEGGDIVDVLVEASATRFRPVIVTALTTISGLLPTAYEIGGSDAILVPLTMAMAWGLTTGTILTLVWIPCAYAILEDMVNFFTSIKERITKKIALLNF